MSNFLNFKSNSFLEFSSFVLLSELNSIQKKDNYFYYNNFLLFSNDFINYLKKIKKDESIKSLEDSFFSISLKNKKLSIKYYPKEDILDFIKINKKLQSTNCFQQKNEVIDENTVEIVTKILFTEIGHLVNNNDSYFNMFLNIIHLYNKEKKDEKENILYKLEYISRLFNLSYDTINSLKLSLN